MCVFTDCVDDHLLLLVRLIDSPYLLVKIKACAEGGGTDQWNGPGGGASTRGRAIRHQRPGSPVSAVFG